MELLRSIAMPNIKRVPRSALFFMTSAVACAGLSHAGSVTYPDEYGRHIHQASLISSMQGQFGESIDLNSGSLEILQTDIVLPGIGPDVRVGRRYRPSDTYGRGHFNYWDIDLPHMHGTFAKAAGTNQSNGWRGWGAKGTRCSQFTAPLDVSVQGGIFSPDEYWSGSFLYMPGAGEQELLERAGAPVPNDGRTYPIVTKAGNVVRCVALATSSESGAVGEGFEVVGADGTVYTLNQYVSRIERTMTKSDPSPLALTIGGAEAAQRTQKSKRAGALASQGVDTGGNPQLAAVGYNLPRQEILLYPTKVTDRFGNSVSYTWSSTNPWQLLRIEASDGRHLDFTYVGATDSRVSSITDGSRTWTYAYSGVLGPSDSPDTLTLPDGSLWTYRLSRLSYAGPRPFGGSCDGLNSSTATYSGSISGPSGATMTLVMRPMLFGRSAVYRECIHQYPYDGSNEYAREPYLFGGFSVVSKTITGPGLPAVGQTWTYAYGPPNNCWLDPGGGVSTGTVCTPNSPSTRTVSVTDPDGIVTRHTFGNRYMVNEGLLLKVEYGWNGTTALRTVDYTYADPEAAPYGSSNGRSLRNMGNYDITGFMRPQRLVTTTQQGRTLVWQVAADCSGIPYCFDALARPTKIVRTSSP